MPRKFRLGRHYKNERVKKRQSALSTLSSTSCAVARQSHPSTPTSLIVSLPLQVFTNSPVSSVSTLGDQLKALDLIPSG